MKVSFMILVSMLFGVISTAQKVPQWETKQYRSFVDGNQLYSECQEWNRDVTVSVEHNIEVRGNRGADLYEAGACWGYILSVADLIPAGESFS